MAIYGKRRKIYRGRRAKYNINSLTFNEVAPADWSAIGTPAVMIATSKVVVQPSQVGGTRKVKNFNLTMTATADIAVPIFWALVYVPEGTSPSTPSITGEGYQPSNYVIAQGMLNSQTPVRAKSRLSRNLNQNDSIYMLLWTPINSVPSDPLPISGFMSYAICYN